MLNQILSFSVGLICGAIITFLFLERERQDTRRLMDIVIDERQKLRKELYELKEELKLKYKFNKKDDE